MTYNEKVANKLNELLQKTFYSEKGFKKAAHYAKNEELKVFFKNGAKQRKEFGNKLKYEIKSFHATAEDMGSLVGSGHLLWMDAKLLLSSNEKMTLLKSIIKEEHSIVLKYKNVINKLKLPFETKNILMAQKNQLEIDISKLSDIKEEF